MEYEVTLDVRVVGYNTTLGSDEDGSEDDCGESLHPIVERFACNSPPGKNPVWRIVRSCLGVTWSCIEFQTKEEADTFWQNNG